MIKLLSSPSAIPEGKVTFRREPTESCKFGGSF